MKTQNKVQLIGYLGQDPDFVVLDSGSKKARLRVATDRFVPQEGKEDKQVTTWHTVIAWNDLAEQAQRTMMKGSHISVEGELRYREYTNKKGLRVNATEINANLFIDLDR